MLRLEYKDDSLGHSAVASFSRLVGFAAISTYFLIVLGSAVRATQSGLACPDWPLCFSSMVPEFDFQIFMEWIHRVFAGAVCLFYGLIMWRFFRSKKLRSLFLGQVLLAFALLVVQVILGGLTVLQLLEPKIVSMHLMNALLFLGILSWMHVKAEHHSKLVQPESWRIPPVIKRSLFALSILIFMQIFLGGMVSTTHSGLVCADFPTCHGRWFSDFAFPEWLQMGHRYFAYIIAAAVFALAMFSTGLKLPPRSKRAVRWLPVLVILQIVLGVTNVLWFVPVSVTVAHLANAVLMLIFSWTAGVELMMIRIQYPSEGLIKRSLQSYEGDLRAGISNASSTDPKKAEPVGVS